MDSEPVNSKGPEHHLRTIASALTLTASFVALSAQIVAHFRKPKAGSGERTKAGTALLGLSALRMLPSMIKTAKSIAAEIKHTT